MLVDTDDLLNQAQIADLVGLSRERISQLACRPDFPRRILKCKGTENTGFWLKDDILQWDAVRLSKNTKRGRPRKNTEEFLREYEKLIASGLKHKQIAEKWGITPTSLSKKIWYCRQKLKGVTQWKFY